MALYNVPMAIETSIFPVRTYAVTMLVIMHITLQVIDLINDLFLVSVINSNCQTRL